MGHHAAVPAQAEDQRIAGAIADIRVHVLGLGAEEPEPVAAHLGGDLVEMVDDPQVEMLPVVEPRAADVPIVEQEAERAD